MRQVKDWALVNGGAPFLLIFGFTTWATRISRPIGIVLIAVGIIWFVAWLDPVRKALIRFLSYPDGMESTEATEDETGARVVVKEGSTLIQHFHAPQSSEGSSETDGKPTN